MKQNLLILSYDYTLSKRLSAKFADNFSMRVFDQRELFEFDHLPRSFSEVLLERGKEYIFKKFKSIIKMEFDFENTVFVADYSLADYAYDIFHNIKLANFTIYLYKNVEDELSEVLSKDYASNAEKEFYKIDEPLLLERENEIKNNLADITVDITGLTDDQIIDVVNQKMQNYYAK